MRLNFKTKMELSMAQQLETFLESSSKGLGVWLNGKVLSLHFAGLVSIPSIRKKESGQWQYTHLGGRGKQNLVNLRLFWSYKASLRLARTTQCVSVNV